MQSQGSYVCDSCGEVIEVPIDLSAGSRQQYVEDCPVCCSPVLLHVHVEPDGEISISASAE